MRKEHFIERHKGGERVILVQLFFYQQTPEHALDEFIELATSANLNILDVITASRDKPAPRYFMGGGKAEEVAEAVTRHQADAVIVNHALSAPQGRNLEKLFKVKVIDRTELILDIFAQRAQTFEGKLQVEYAQLQHLSTQLIRGWAHLERQKGGIGLRGPGETQLESDRRMIGVRMKTLRKRLDKVAMQRAQGRKGRQRREVPSIALVGYTNAGKSTLFNALTEADIYVADQLFATLDPTVRQIQLPHFGKAVLADTVGFIRNLPHDLVAAFRATLEETREADLLLHVVDASANDREQTIASVEAVLKEIDAFDVPQLFVFNKIDLLDKAGPRLDNAADGRPRRVWVSAKAREGFALLHKAIVENLRGQLIETQITLPFNSGKIQAKLYAQNVVQSESFNEQGQIVLNLRISRQALDALLTELKDN